MGIVFCMIHGCDDAVCLQKVLDDLSHSDIGKSGEAMLKCAEVHFDDCVDQFLIQCPINILKPAPESKGFLVVSEDFIDLCCHLIA
jgi:hypothetical protein